MMFSSMRHTFTFGFAAAAFVISTAAAHDFWIQPSDFTPTAGDLINIMLRVGHVDEPEVVVRNPQRIEQFIVVGPDGEKPVLGTDGKDPAGFIRPSQPGLYTIGYRSNHASIELEAQKFEAYLKEEGLERIVDLRTQRGQTNQPGREIYSRCAKCMLAVGGESSEGYDRPLGFPFEIVPLANPTTLNSGDSLPLQLLLHGQPCAGCKVTAKNSLHPHGIASARTDDQGRASLTLPTGGAWLIAAVTMIEISPSDGQPVGKPSASAEWESFWASLAVHIARE